MIDARRRRLLQAGVSMPFAGWGAAWAQTPDRNLAATEKKAAALPSAASLLLAPRHALIIGNSDYGFGPLKNPANDAKAIGEELKRAGFEVTVGLDLSRAKMLEAIRAYGESLNRTKAVGVFYYAGHGLQLAWRNYLVPTDAAIAKVDDIQARCVDVNAVIEGIAKAVNPMNVVILDACRENPFGNDMRLDQKGLSQLDAPPGTLLAYATAPGNLASDGAGANGLYTEQLLREMKVPEAKIEDVFKRVRLAVRRRSNGQQIPWESTSLEEDFWFIPPKEMQRLAAEEAERQRKAAEAERLWQERIARAQREEAERMQREADAARARQEAEEQRRREQLEREYKAQLERRRQQEQSDRAYEEELRFWERVAGAKEPGPLEDYLRRYPSGRFCELAQVQLDRVLAQQGETKVEAVSATENPYSQGTATFKPAYKVGDMYTYNFMDLYSKVVSQTNSLRITEINDTQVIYNNGRLVTDLLGNGVRLPDGRRLTPSQVVPTEFKVGKKWRTRFNVTHPKFGEFRTTFDIRIAARERVTVPAGTFECYRLEGLGQSEGAQTIRLEVTTWMAPDRCRRPIARNEIRRNQHVLIVAERQELVSFTRG
jgi:uncharacterized caspase-like protein